MRREKKGGSGGKSERKEERKGENEKMNESVKDIRRKRKPCVDS